VSEQLVVDGYNVIHAWRDLRSLIAESLELARERLVSRLAILAQVTGAEVSVVFDAHRRKAPGRPEPATESESSVDGVRVAFTRRAKSADQVIERMAYEAQERGTPLLVATSDSLHRAMLRGMGAAVIDADELLRRVIAAEAELARRLRAYSGR
jgi:predicted RNA-binding protein with PIN domain